MLNEAGKYQLQKIDKGMAYDFNLTHGCNIPVVLNAIWQ